MTTIEACDRVRVTDQGSHHFAFVGKVVSLDAEERVVRVRFTNAHGRTYDLSFGLDDLEVWPG